MPRQPRFYFPGAVLHVVQRGNDRAPVFKCNHDRRFYLECLREASREHEVAIHAYVSMTNHVHLLVSPATARSLPRMMQTVGRRYVGRFNFLYQRSGTLWEGRYRAALVETDSYLLACLRYVELNPVRAGIVAAPAEFRWSSHRANAYGHDDPIVTPHPLLGALAPSPGTRHQWYRDLFSHALGEQTMSEIRDASQFEWVRGSAQFRSHVEAITGRRAARLTLGRPRSGSES